MRPNLTCCLALCLLPLASIHADHRSPDASRPVPPSSWLNIMSTQPNPDFLSRIFHRFTLSTVAPAQLFAPLDTNPASSSPQKLQVGARAPAFALPTLDGKTVKLNDYVGKVVLLTFWSTASASASAQTLHLKAVYDRFGASPDFVMISLSLDHDPQPPREYVQAQGLHGIHAHLGDPAQSAVAHAYGVTSIPQSILIGSDGRIFASDLPTDALTSTVELALWTVPHFAN